MKIRDFSLMGVLMAFYLSSSAFLPNSEIPQVYTCEGPDVSPPLKWTGPPEGTKSFALIMDDPDAPDPKAPKRTWVHWVVYNIPQTATGLVQSAQGKNLPPGTLFGNNDWNRARYGGPCPHIGRHRYFYKLYALDTVLPDLGLPTKAALENAMKGHIILQATLIGTYQKKGYKEGG